MVVDMLQKERILVGMSGGVDSSAVCMLLQDEGYEVVGLTLRMHHRHNKSPIISWRLASWPKNWA